MADSTLILEDVERGIRRITLDRPDKRNPLTPKCVRELVGAVTESERDPSCHVVVIRGAGPAFSSGYGIIPEDLEPGDLPEGEPTVRDDVEAMREHGHQWARIWDARVPVIAQVHGACIAGGADLAMHCDLVVTADDAEIGFPPVRSMGVPPTHMWLYHVGPQWAKRLLLTGDRISGRTAHRIGFAVESVPAGELEEAVTAIARRMTLVDRDLLAGNKAVVNQGVELMGRRALQYVAAASDGIAHTAGSAQRFNEVAAAEGFKAAYRDRDAPFDALGDDPL